MKDSLRLAGSVGRYNLDFARWGELLRHFATFSTVDSPAGASSYDASRHFQLLIRPLGRPPTTLRDLSNH